MPMINNPIYVDHNRTTLPAPEVTEAMHHFSALTPDSDLRKQALHEAKQHLANLLNDKASNLYFTKGTSHGLRLGIHLLVNAMEAPKKIITCKTEHPAVLNTCNELEEKGIEVIYLDVDREGKMDLDVLESNLKSGRALVCIMAANNETGVIQDLESIAALCVLYDSLFFSDASQYAGKMRIDLNEVNMHALAFGSHKMYGPEGIGLLYLRDSDRFFPFLDSVQTELEEVKSHPDFETKLIGFGEAARIFNEQHWDISTHVSKLRNYFEHQLLEIDGLRINGSTRTRLYNTSNLTFPASKHPQSLLEEYQFAHNQNRVSHVLASMQLSEEEIHRSFRFSFGKNNTLDEIRQLVEALMQC